MTIEWWLRARFGRVVSASGGEDVRVNCPFCESRHNSVDNKFHLYVSLVKPVAHCFRCSWAGHWIGLIISVEGCSYAEAMLYIHKPPTDINRFDRLYSTRGLVRGEQIASVPEGFMEWSDIEHRLDSNESYAVYCYAVKRLSKVWDLEGNILVAQHFGWVPGSNRLWILIDETWWQGRAIVKMDPKYLSPPWPRGDALWNGKALRLYDEITICEGVFSAIHAGSHAVALCSKTMNKEQAKRIATTKAQTIVIMLDADAYDEPYIVARQLEKAGYGGDIVIHKLDWGDPCDGLEGDQIIYDYSTHVHHVLQNV